MQDFQLFANATFKLVPLCGQAQHHSPDTSCTPHAAQPSYLQKDNAFLNISKYDRLLQ